MQKGAEEYYIGCGLQHVSQLFIATFEGESGLSTGQPAIEDTISGEQDGAGVLDELAVDETKAYKQKISKYIRSSLSCVKEALFFAMMLLGHKCREPLLHHYRFLCKKLTDTSMHVVELVTGHIATICSEFEALLACTHEWSGDITRAVGGIHTCHSLDDNDRMYITLGGLAILLHNAACFDRRIVKQFARWGDVSSVFYRNKNLLTTPCISTTTTTTITLPLQPTHFRA